MCSVQIIKLQLEEQLKLLSMVRVYHEPLHRASTHTQVFLVELQSSEAEVLGSSSATAAAAAPTDGAAAAPAPEDPIVQYVIVRKVWCVRARLEGQSGFGLCDLPVQLIWSESGPVVREKLGSHK
jgi:hypothetical protein